MAEVVVRNGGAVIDPDQVQALTEPFRRLSRSSGGFGLGLSIVRSVAQVHGGTVELTAPAAGRPAGTRAGPAAHRPAAKSPGGHALLHGPDSKLTGPLAQKPCIHRLSAEVGSGKAVLTLLHRFLYGIVP